MYSFNSKRKLKPSEQGLRERTSGRILREFLHHAIEFSNRWCYEGTTFAFNSGQYAVDYLYAVGLPRRTVDLTAHSMSSRAQYEKQGTPSMRFIANQGKMMATRDLGQERFRRIIHRQLKNYPHMTL